MASRRCARSDLRNGRRRSTSARSPAPSASILWVYALERATPTRVANTITVSPIAAALLGAVLLGEPIGVSLLIGIAAVALGIWIASR